MFLEFRLQQSLWPSLRFAYHAARDAFVIAEAGSTANLSVETSVAEGSFCYEIHGDVDALLLFIDLLLTEGVLRFVVRANGEDAGRLRQRFPGIEGFPSQVLVLPGPLGGG